MVGRQNILRANPGSEIKRIVLDGTITTVLTHPKRRDAIIPLQTVAGLLYLPPRS